MTQKQLRTEHKHNQKIQGYLATTDKLFISTGSGIITLPFPYSNVCLCTFRTFMQMQGGCNRNVSTDYNNASVEG